MEYFKNETGSRIFKHETTHCNLQTAIYYGDFGVLQKTIFFGFIFMKLEFRCTKSYIKLEFCFCMNETNRRFSASLHRNCLRCNNFGAVIFFPETFLQFHSFIFFLQFHFFYETRFTLFASFIIFFHFFLRKNTSFWPVF